MLRERLEFRFSVRKYTFFFLVYIYLTIPRSPEASRESMTKAKCRAICDPLSHVTTGARRMIDGHNLQEPPIPSYILYPHSKQTLPHPHEGPKV